MQNTEYTGFYRYWGKACKQTDEKLLAHHLLPYHCLDVAAVGEVLLTQHKNLTQQLAERLSLDRPQFTRWHCFFLAIHDLGKFSSAFQALCPSLCPPSIDTAKNYREKHDSLGWWLWQEKIMDAVFTDSILNPAIFDPWVQATTGHHGQPPKDGYQIYSSIRDHFTAMDIEAAKDFASTCLDLFKPESFSDEQQDKLECTLKPVSWWLAGVSVLCDWLGSDKNFFVYRTDQMPLDKYYQHALSIAETALQASGVLPLEPVEQSLDSLFSYLSPPTPLQQFAADLPLSSAPQLFLLEDVTGAGKTEAALMLANRLVASGQADGVYFGLPTMATSNAMLDRIGKNKLAEKFFNGTPELLLAHSAARFQQRVTQEASAEMDYQKDEFSASSQRGAWLHDNRKKSLLADFAVGTIDQALLAVLYSRYQSLRLLGLSRRVLIVDEVHACDAYMQKLLEGLLTFHAFIGGSAILLSATLPQKQRASLAAAFCNGIEQPRPTLEKNDYPLLTHVHLDTAGQSIVVDEHPLQTRSGIARQVKVQWIHSFEAACELLKSAQAAGRCACWIRNTVQDVNDAYQALQAEGVNRLKLFHARFAMTDRQKIETDVLNRFGLDSQPEQRQGQILVSSQVCEQSLDIDFDVMLSDLAPIDLLIQRAGRLHRHARGDRGEPVLTIFAPETTETPAADWYSAVFRKGAYVYENHAQLWLTMRVLQAKGGLNVPTDSRELIETVYSENADIPKGLQQVNTDTDGKRKAKAGTAARNTLALRHGYGDPKQPFWDDAITRTRDGDESITVRLAKWQAGQLRPWADVDEEKIAWQSSQVSVPLSILKSAIEFDDPELKKAFKAYQETVFDKGRWSILLVLQETDGGWFGNALDKHDQPVRVQYDGVWGLRKVE